MKSNYYDEMLREIKSLYKNGDINEATRRLDNELQMPYIPADIETELLKLKDLYKSERNVNKKLSTDELYDYLLSKDPFKELVACEEFDKMNLRDHHDVIQEYLLSAVNDNARSLMVASLIAQGIREEYTIVKNGIEYNFVPLYCDEIQMSDGYISAMSFIDKTIGNENASIEDLAKSLIIKLCFDALPMSLCEEEGILYAKSIIIYIFDLFCDRDGKEDFIAKYVDDKDVLFEKTALDKIFGA